MKTTELERLLKRANENLDAYIYNVNEPARKKEALRKSKIVNAKSFSIELYFNEESWYKRYGKLNFHGTFEEFEVSRLSDAALLFDTYRKMGHNIGLTKIVVRAEDEVVYKLNFKYSIRK